MWNLRSSVDVMGCSGLDVTPPEADVPAGGSFLFRVCLAPTKSNRYFSEDAEAFVSPANQMTFGYVSVLIPLFSQASVKMPPNVHRTDVLFASRFGVHRMVNDATQQPPWCLPLRVHGHSFIGGQFLAKGSLSTQHTGQKLLFPACHVGDTVYQTIRSRPLVFLKQTKT